jgi:hypothetical protein
MFVAMCTQFEDGRRLPVVRDIEVDDISGPIAGQAGQDAMPERLDMAAELGQNRGVGLYPCDAGRTKGDVGFGLFSDVGPDVNDLADVKSVFDDERLEIE